jgi:hypothetical protein
MNIPHAPGYFWTRTRCIPVPLPAYTFIDSDGALWVSVPAQDVVWVYVALFLAGVALMDDWQRANPEPVSSSPLSVGGHWLGVSDGDARARDLFKRHYSYRAYKDGRKPKLFVGPGEKMVLMTVNCDALFVWRKFISRNNQQGVNCAIFRNESSIRASDLIREAMELAWKRWPGERLYTYVNAKKIRSTNPGYCYKMAGWQVCGETKGGLLILEALPEGYVAPEPLATLLARVGEVTLIERQMSLFEEVA